MWVLPQRKHSAISSGEGDPYRLLYATTCGSTCGSLPSPSHLRPSLCLHPTRLVFTILIGLSSRMDTRRLPPNASRTGPARNPTARTPSIASLFNVCPSMCAPERPSVHNALHSHKHVHLCAHESLCRCGIACKWHWDSELAMQISVGVRRPLLLEAHPQGCLATTVQVRHPMAPMAGRQWTPSTLTTPPSPVQPCKSAHPDATRGAKLAEQCVSETVPRSERNFGRQDKCR